MQHDGVDPVAPGDAVQPITAHLAENAPHLILIVGNIRRRRCPPLDRLTRLGRRRDGIEHLDERAGSGRFDAHRFDHGHTQLDAKLVGIDDNAFTACDIRHVERNDHGQPQPFQAQNQSQVLPQVGRIGDADDEVRQGLARTPPEQHIGRHLFIGCQRIEAVRTG